MSVQPAPWPLCTDVVICEFSSRTMSGALSVMLPPSEVSARVEMLPPFIVMRSPAVIITLPVRPAPVLSALMWPPLTTLT